MVGVGTLAIPAKVGPWNENAFVSVATPKKCTVRLSFSPPLLKPTGTVHKSALLLSLSAKEQRNEPM